ncbi:hypothetical protein ABZP36_008089 [Zizania latifolia]
MSPIVSTSLAYHIYLCLAMPCLNSFVTPKMRQLKLTAAATDLLVVVFLAVFVGSCEARRLRACGKVSYSSTKPSLPSAQCKDVTNMQLHGSDRTTNQTKDLSDAIDGHVVGADAKAEEGVAMAPSTGAVETKIVVRVSNWLSHKVQGEDDDTMFRLDYAGPRAHPPSHNW